MDAGACAHSHINWLSQPFLRVPPETVVWFEDTIKDNSGINNNFIKSLMESYW